tara:strand:- start:679 stop:951 length:273 start_codon:yes stop_codon:yes gene_type:complete
MSEWFFIRQKHGKILDSLKKNRRIIVAWEIDETTSSLPSEVTLPVEIFHGIFTSRDLDRSICNFLSSKFGHSVSSWQVSFRNEEKNEKRI